MSAETVSAADLLGALPQPVKPAGPEPLPAGVKIRPAHPGANYGRHPVSKKFVSLRDYPPEQIEAAAPPPPPTPQNPPETATAPPSPVSAPEPPKPAAAPPQAPPPPAAVPKPEAGPDFSDLPPAGDANPPGQAPPAAEAKQPGQSSHLAVATMIFRLVVQLLASWLGGEWLPRKIKLVDGATGEITEIDEELHMVGSIAGALEYVGAAMLNPIQVMWCNVAGYVAPRLGTLGRWWKNRKAEKMADMRRAKPTAPAEPTKSEPANA